MSESNGTFPETFVPDRPATVRMLFDRYEVGTTREGEQKLIAVGEIDGRERSLWLLGTALTHFLTTGGHRVVRFVRGQRRIEPRPPSDVDASLPPPASRLPDTTTAPPPSTSESTPAPSASPQPTP